MDSKIVQVALNGLENILRLGEQDAKMHGGNNPYAVMIEECYGRNQPLRCHDLGVGAMVRTSPYVVMI